MITWLMMSFAFAQDGPEISRSRGKADGFVVLYPRIVTPDTEPKDRSNVALQAQQKIADLLTGRGHVVDVRPSPQRVCPRSGCKGQTVEIVLAHMQEGCTLTAVHRSEPQGPGVLVALAGQQSFKRATVPFRSQPERQLVVGEFLACDKVVEAMDFAALQQALPAVP